MEDRWGETAGMVVDRFTRVSRRVRRWILRISRSPLGVFAAAVLLLVMVGISFVSLDDDFFRQKLIGTVAESTDYRVEIDGSFQVHLSLTPGFEATRVKIREQGTPDIYAIERLALNVSLFSLLFGDPVISSLAIQGVEIDLAFAAAPAEHPPEDMQPATLKDLQVPLVKNLKLRNVLLRYGEERTLLLNEWTIREARIGDAMHLDGRGLLDNRDYRINGRFGSFADLVDPEKPYPLNIELQYQAASISLEGTISQPLKTGGLQLTIEADSPDLSAILAAYGLQAPPLGGLKAKGELTGSLEQPSLENLIITLSKGQTLSLEASGSIVNPLAMENDVIQVTGSTDDSELLTWILPDDLAGTEQWKLQGKLVTAKTGLRLEDLYAEAIDPRGLTLKASGSGVLENFSAQQPFSSLDILVTFTSSNTVAARPLLIDALPELGPVEGSLRMTAVSKEDLAFEDIDVTAGLDREVTLKVKGRMAQVPLDADTPNTGIDLQLDLSADKAGKLAELFAIDLPAIEPVRIKGRFTGSRLKSSLREISLQAGKPKQLTLNANGSIHFDDFSRDDYLKDVNLRIGFAAPATRAVAEFIGQELPELGPAKGRFTLRGNLEKLQARDISLEAGQSDELLLGATGEVRKIALTPKLTPTGIRLQLAANAPATDKLTPLLGFDLPNLGALNANAQLVDQDGSLGVERAEIRVGPADKPVLRATGQIDDIYKRKGIAGQIHLDIGTDETLTSLLGRPLPDLGKLHGDVELSDADGSLGIEKIEISSDRKDLLNVRISGLFDDLRETDKLDMEVEISTHSLEIIGLVLGQNWPASNPAKLTGRFKAEKRQGTFDGKLTVGKTEITARLGGSLVDPHPKLRGKIGTEVVYLTDFGFPESEPEQPDPETRETKEKVRTSSKSRENLFSKEPLSLDWLRKFDLDLNILADDVVGTNAKLDSFVIPVEVKDGVLLVTPVTFIFEQGVILVDYMLDSNATPPRTGLKITADDVAVGRALAHVGAHVPIDGSLNVNVDLSSNGQTVAEMTSNLNGVIELGMENISLPKATIDLLAVDLFGWAISSTFGRGREAKLHCGIVRLKAKKGQLTSEILFFDGPTLTISGEGTVDLAGETIDLSIYPKRKKRFWSNVTPVHITGPLADPSFKAVPGGAAATGYAGLTAVPQIFIPVTALGYLGDLFSRDESKGDDSACLEYTRKAE